MKLKFKYFKTSSKDNLFAVSRANEMCNFQGCLRSFDTAHASKMNSADRALTMTTDVRLNSWNSSNQNI